jgi:hypothetical protein
MSPNFMITSSDDSPYYYETTDITPPPLMGFHAPAIFHAAKVICKYCDSVYVPDTNSKSHNCPQCGAPQGA